MLNLRLIITSGLAIPLIAYLALHLAPSLTLLLSGAHPAPPPRGAKDSPSPSPAVSSPSPPAMASSVARSAPLVFPALGGKHTATVFFMHGLGDTGAGWADAHWRGRRRLDQVKFVLPNAPIAPVTLNAGFPMPSWFDIKSLAPTDLSPQSVAHNEDVGGILASRGYLHSLIQDEISAGIPADRIVLGGFSQGGAMSILAGLTSPVKIAGIVGLSSWLLLSQTFRDHVPEGDVNKATPILMAHGDRDQVVRYDVGQTSEKALKEMGYDVTFKTYRGMEHSATLEELNEVEAFLVSRLPSKEQ
ncbi:Acyl-protein thioesterase 1 [Hirsutella minnesotensis 3608]|nr:Acyl-protein thioesterase 1 [Hirsutella minnesotensis 3608]